MTAAAPIRPTTPGELSARLRELADEPMPAPGAGSTAARHRRLWELAAESPALGRLAEAHFDGVAILAEAGRKAPRGATLGVWAADGPQPLELAAGSNLLRGPKSWCSGASLVSHALVTCRRGTEQLLMLVDLAEPGVTGAVDDPMAWQAEAFAAIDTSTVCFDITISDDDIIGPAGWYLDRPGFWHGAVGVAACWAGAAAGRVDEVRAGWRRDPHALAHLGAIDARCWGLRSALDIAAAEIDAAPADVDAAHRRALRVRHLVDDGVADITARIGRALGPRPFAYDNGFQQRMSEVDLYRRQCHAERDLEQLGLLVAAPSVATRGPNVH